MRNKAHKTKRKTRYTETTDTNASNRFDSRTVRRSVITEASDAATITGNILILIGIVFLPMILVAAGMRALINLYLGV